MRVGSVAIRGWAAVDAGRDDRFRAFFVAEFPRLAGYCTGLTGERQAGEDAAQEALVRTWARWSRVEDPVAYSFLVATKLISRQWQREARRRLLRTAMPLGATTAPGPDRSLRDLVDRLPARLRLPVLLHYYADLPVVEVAGVLEIPQGSVRQRLHQARQTLATAYQEGL
jgi:RNA polymerase sigma-70 factor (ECF subfamily)